MAASGFYDVGALRQVAINLFYGWGYNFYRTENQLRADDQLVRSKAAWLLGQAVAVLQVTEADYRRDALPPPTREKPFADAAAVAAAQALERLGRDVAALEARLHAQPVPENDRMTQRYRQEAETLARLVECDQALIGQAELLRATVDDKAAAWVLDNLADLKEGLAAIQTSLRRREEMLMG